MEIQELRLGNYVQYEMNSFHIAVESIELVNNLVNATDIEYLKPISLTDEWLIKLGFEKSDSSSNCMKKTNGYKFDFAGGEVLYLDSVRLKHIKYIHQLQNLYFALGGEELQIQNDEK
ncbi:hypothetical protein [Elizabethkingia meningoseptica]|uniref:hypothetical protein n=1 Tax=Elizabethkingia meningoseptica TaxID=238 RepID=UPI001626B1EB|nr:hypothetical protein [Elizabethkingia meningoseptica]MBG0512930.1 hypothetical protein [Elizabethkingia meningoseptica]MBG0515197.1 hypothetical protein [Elizabethkingia meningoseptica]HCD9234524.1 hypothetical protein [Elizabethkingia anophelis]